MSLMAVASTIFQIVNFLMALSLGTQQAQLVQRIGRMRLWPFLAPLSLLFLVILEVQRQEPFDIYWHNLNQILMKPFWPLAHFGMLQRALVCVCVCVCVSRSVMSDSFPMDCSLPGSSTHGILQARILEWVAIPFSKGSSWLRDWTQVSRIAGRFFTIWANREALKEPVGHPKERY